MKDQIINIFTLKTCLRLILASFAFSFLMFGINFTQLLMPSKLYITTVLIPALIAVLGYIGYITRFVYLWKMSSKPLMFDNMLTIISVGILLSFSLFLSLGLTLPALNYPRQNIHLSK